MVLPNSVNILKIGLICSCGEMHIGGFGKIELALALGEFVSNGDTWYSLDCIIKFVS